MLPKIITPEGFNLLSNPQKTMVCNGAGPKGSWYSRLIPEIKCIKAFNRHDYMYYRALEYSGWKRVAEKLRADAILYHNMGCALSREAWYKRWLRKPYTKACVYGGYKSVGIKTGRVMDRRLEQFNRDSWDWVKNVDPTELTNFDKALRSMRDHNLCLEITWLGYGVEKKLNRRIR